VPTLPTIQRYLLAFLIILVALLVRTIMAPLWETTAPFALFMFATVIAAWYAGTGPAIVTGAAGFLSRLYFDSPRGPGALPVTWEEAVRLTLYGGFVIGTAVILNRMRNDRLDLEASIVAARRELEQRRQAEEALAAAKASAEAANHAKDEFLALVSHELRTPINAILGWTTLLRNDALPAERSRYAVDVIHKNAKMQAQLVTDLLDVARGLTGRIQLEPARLDFHIVVKDVVALLQESAAARQIQLSFAADDSPIAVWGDLSRLQQVVGNLVSNAIKFTPEGGHVEVTLARHDRQAELVVTDTGAGIEPEFAPHLFEPFQQADSGATRRYGGLGLGLALVRQLVELHGGSVSGSAAGADRGALFTVRLPIQGEEATSADGSDSALTP
jgi:signal transduction histidine kinase